MLLLPAWIQLLLLLLLIGDHYVVARAPSSDAVTACLELEKPGAKSRQEHLDERPRFDGTAAQSMDVPLHEPAYLHCRVIRQGDHQVAWTRANDGNLLTVGEESFTNDARFQISVKSSVSDWVLIIRRTERKDTGCYLCEVNSEPDSQIYPVYLNVIERPLLDEWSSSPSLSNESTAAQNDATLKVAPVGKNIVLTCLVNLQLDIAQNDLVVWTKNDIAIDTDEGKSKKYQLSKMKRDKQTVIHTLEIVDATSRDDGLYACRADSAPIKEHLVQVTAASSPLLRDRRPWSVGLLAPILLLIVRS